MLKLLGNNLNILFSKTIKRMSHLLEFYGEECPHCMDMKKVVAELQEKEGIVVESKEVWHNEENLKEMEALDQGKCGGVPYFYNKETQKWICGEASYGELLDWAQGK